MSSLPTVCLRFRLSRASVFWLLAVTSLVFVCHVIADNQVGDRSSSCVTKADIVFVVDSSGSINEHDKGNWDRVKNFAKNIVGKLDIGEDRVRVGMVEFGNEGFVQFYLNSHYNVPDITADIDRLPFLDANTNTSGGLYVMMKHVFNVANGDRPHVPDTAIVITDGRSTYDSNLTIPYAEEAKRRGIKIIALGIGRDINEEELRGIASPPGEHKTVFTVADFRDLNAILSEFMLETCQHFTSLSTPVRVPTTITTTTTTTTPTTTTTTPTTTTTTTTIAPPPLSLACERETDIAILMDSSANIGMSKFMTLKSVAANVIELLSIETGDVRVAVVTYAQNADVNVYLGRFTTRRDVLSVVLPLRQSAQTGSNMAAGFQRLYNDVFTSSRGSRATATKFVIVLTDGTTSRDPDDTQFHVKRLKRELGVMVVVLAVGPSWWIDVHQLYSVASYPTSRSVIIRRRVDDDDVQLATTLHALVCQGGCRTQRNQCSVTSRQCSDAPGSVFCHCYEGYAGTDCSQEPADVVLAVDTSRSIGRVNMVRVFDYCQSLALGMHSRSRLALVTFSDQARLIQNLTDDINYHRTLDILSASYRPVPSTDTAGALRLACQLLSTAPVHQRRVALLIVDGRSNDMPATKLEADQCWKSGVQLMVVGVDGEVSGDFWALKELRTVSRSVTAIADDRRARRLFLSPNFESLGNTRQPMVDALCGNNGACAVRFPCQNGGICSDVIDDDYVCRCPALRFTGRRCQRRCSNIVDLVFAIDKSGSISNDRLPIVINFVKKVVTDLEVATDRTLVGALSWADSVDIDFRLDDYVSRAEVLNELDYIRYTGGLTNTAAALNTLRNQMFWTSSRPGAILPDSSTRWVSTSSVTSRVAVVVTDGNSNVDSSRTVPEAVALHQAGVHVITVSVGRIYNQSELRAIASLNGSLGNMFHADRFDQLEALASNVQSAICNEVDECASNPCQFGGRCIDSLRHYTCLCTERRTGNNCQYECWRRVDLALVLDMSGSTEHHHQLALKLSRLLVDRLDVGRQTRVALLSFGDQSTTHFNFNTYITKSQVMSAISIVPTRGGRTNTQEALLRVRTEAFTPSSGAREDAEDVVVLVTDGRSNVQRDWTQRRAAELRQSGVIVYVIAFNDADVTEAQGIAGSTGLVQLVRNDQEAERAVDVIAGRLCQRQ